MKYFLILFSFFFTVQTIAQVKIYSENFNTSNGGWVINRVSELSESWVHSNSSFTGNNTGHWHTTPFNDYNNNMFIKVNSPNLDFSGKDDMTLNLRLRYKTESLWDGVNIQYTIDNGANWTRLGNIGSNGSNNWYNDTDVDALGNNVDGWSGNNNTWRTSSIPLPAILNNKNNVYIRIVFASDISIIEDGVGFDDIELTENGIAFYSENFDNDDGNWSTDDISTADEWIRNNTSFTGNTSNHWHTNPYNNYENNMKAVVTSPVLDLSDFSEMSFSMLLRHKTETAWDGVNVEYSTDGTVWTVLGSVSTNWYNDTDVDGIKDNVDGWSGNNDAWTTVTTTLPQILNNNNSVQFRIRFGSDGSVLEDGVGFDDVAILVNYDNITINSGNFNDPTIWKNGSVPPNGASLIIDKTHQIALTTDETTGEILLLDGANIDLVSHTLEINSSSIIDNGSGSLTSGTGKVRYSGANSQNISAFNYYDLELAGDGTKTLNGATRIENGLTVTGNTISLITNNLLTIGSSTDGTGYVGQLPNDFNITGEVTVERYIGALKRKWWHLSSPVSEANAAQWQDDFPITGDFTGMQDLGGSNNSSVKWYDESIISPTISDGWKEFPAVGGSNIENMIIGRGYRAFLRNNGTSTIGEVTVDLSGNMNMGDIELGVNYTSSGTQTADGWSFVGNPYPCTIDWSSTGWDLNNIAGAVYVWDALNSRYSSYVDGVAINGGSKYIASGQAFWVQATGPSPLLRAKESVKVSNNTPLLREKQWNIVNIEVQDEQYSSSTALRFSEEGTYSFNDSQDAHYWGGSYPVNLCTYNNEGNYFSVNTLPIDGSQEIPMWIKHPNTKKEYQLNFTGLNNTEISGNLILIDNYLNIEIPLTDDLNYPFSYNGTEESNGASRFLIKKTDRILGQDNTLPNTYIGVYPNPTNNGNYIINGAENIKKVTMMTTDGQEIEVDFEELTTKKVSVECAHLPLGIYIIRILSNNREYFNKIILN